MVRTLVTGATGTLGTALLPRLRAAGHTVQAASRSPPEEEGNIDWIELDLTAGTGLESVVEDIDIVIHTATAPQGDTAAVDVEGTKRLLEAAEATDIENFLYPSIVGIEDIPFSYYEQKVTAESAVEGSELSTTIIRATQFHSFIAELLDSLMKFPLWPLPTNLQIQPVDVHEVADAIVDHATLTASGRTDPIGGPNIHSVGELAQMYRSMRNLRRPIIRVPIPGKTMTAFRAGHATCPNQRIGTVTWEEWLRQRYASGSGDTTSRVQSSL